MWARILKTLIIVIVIVLICFFAFVFLTLCRSWRVAENIYELENAVVLKNKNHNFIVYSIKNYPKEYSDKVYDLLEYCYNEFYDGSNSVEEFIENQLFSVVILEKEENKELFLLAFDVPGSIYAQGGLLINQKVTIDNLEDYISEVSVYHGIGSNSFYISLDSVDDPDLQ